MTHSKSLYQLKGFRATVLLPIICAGLAWFLIFKSIGYPDFLLTKEGFDNAYEYFKIPLWIAALSLPLAGFYASNHRSVQTAAQINQTLTNNTFSSYYKHVEFFENRYKNIEFDLDLDKHHIIEFEFSSLSNLYMSVFPLNFPHNFSPDYRANNDTYGLEDSLALLQLIFKTPLNFKSPEKNKIDFIDSQNLFSSLSIRNVKIDGETYNLRPKDLLDIEWDEPHIHAVLILACLKLIISLIKYSNSKISMSYKISSNTGFATVDLKGKGFSSTKGSDPLYANSG